MTYQWLMALLLLSAAQSYGQVTVTNKGDANLTITGVNVYLSGSYVNRVDSLSGSTDGALNIGAGDSLFVSGDFINATGSDVINGNNTVVLNGSGIQEILGDSSFSFYQIMIDKAAGDLKLYQAINVTNGLVFGQGNLDLNNHNVELGISGALVNESATNKVLNTEGLIKATRLLSGASISTNQAGLGLYLQSSSNFSFTNIERGHTEQTGAGDGSVLRYWNVNPSNTGFSVSSTKLQYYHSDLNGIPQDELSFWETSTGGAIWNNRYGTLDTVTNTVIGSGFDLVNTIVTTSRFDCDTNPIINLPDTSHLCPGDSTLLNAENPSHIYAWSTGANTQTINVSSTGWYYVTVTSVNGCQSTDSTYVKLENLPTASFTAVSACLGDSLSFTNNSTVSGSSLTYFWDFGDMVVASDTSNEIDPGYQYATSGTYNVLLEATSGFGCKDTSTLNVFQHALPSVSFTASGTCADSTVFFNNTTTIDAPYAINTQAWNFGDGITSTVASPAHAYATTGSYNVSLVATSNAGCVDSAIQAIVIYPNPTASFSANNACEGADVGIVNGSTVSSGGLTYQWSFGDGTNASVANPSKSFANDTSYQIVLTAISGLGCTHKDTQSVVVFDVPSASFTAASTCLDDSVVFSNGSTGSDLPFIYSWSFGDGNTSSLESPSHQFALAGSYDASLVVTSLNGCVDSTSNGMVVHPMPVANFSTNNECLGAFHNFSNGSTISSGSLSYQWAYGNGSISFATSPTTIYPDTGSYNVQLIATSGFGCADTTVSTTTVFPLPSVDIGDSISTCGSSINIDAGNAGASFFWNTLANTQVVNAVINGSYAVTVTDSNGCVAGDDVHVQLNTAPSLSLGPDITACESHTLNVSLSGATYNWSTGDTGSSIVVDTAGTYWLSVIDENGCLSSDTIHIGILAYPVVNLGADDTICEGLSSVFDAANVGANYAWNTGATTQSISATLAGNYVVTVTDSVCSSVDSVALVVNPLPFLDAGPDSGYCVQHTILAGDSALDYLWNTGDTTHFLQVDTTGVYAVTASNAFGCERTDSVTVDIYTLPTVSVGPDSAFCANDSFMINTTASEPVSYLWNDGSVDSSLFAYTSGLFALTVTNANGCSASDTVVLNTDPVPSINFGFSNGCEDSTLAFFDSTLLSSGTINSLLWSFGDGTVSSSINPTHVYSTSGNYTVQLIATSNLGCVDSSEQVISVYPNPVVQFNADSVCEAVDINLTNTSSLLSGTMNYAWDFGDFQSSSLPNPAKNYGTWGSYLITLVGTSNQGCAAKDTQTVEIFDVPNAQYNALDVCASDSVIFNNVSSVNDASLSHAWTFGDGTTSSLPNPVHLYATHGAYNTALVVTSSKGCVDNASAIVNTFEMPNPSFIASDECLGSATTFLNTSSIGVGSLTYQWNFGDGNTSTSTSPNHTYSTDGVYSITLLATSNLGCLDSSAVQANVYELPTVDIGDSIVTCGSTFVLDAGNPGSTYAWSSFANTQTYTATLNGTYAVTVTDSNACIGADTTQVLLNTAAVTDLGPDVTACGSFVLDATSNGASYSWSTGDTTATVEVTTTGSYSVEVTDQNNCYSTDTVNVTINPLPVVDLGENDTICDGVLVTLDAGNVGATYQWSSSASASTSQQVMVGTTGAYNVTVTENGCSASDTIFVQVNPTPVVDLGADSSYCDQHILYAENVNSAYQWSDASVADSLEVFASGSYSVTVTNLFGCSAVDSIDLTIHASPQLNMGSDTSLCQGQQWTITPSVDQTVAFAWSNGSSDSVRVVASTGLFALSVTNAEGCQAADSIQVIIHPLPNVELGSTIILLNGDTATLQTADSTWQHQWFSDTGLVSTSPTYQTSDSGIYSVIVTDSNGCIASDSVFVNALNQNLIARFLCVSQAEVGDTIQFIQLSFPDPLQYSWDFGDGATSTDSSAQHTYFLEDTFQVTLVAYNSLYADTATKQIVITQPNSNAKPQEDSLDLAPKSIFEHILIYPNPTRDLLTVELDLREKAEVDIEFFTIQGLPLYMDQFDDEYFREDYSFFQMPPGMYFMRVISGREIKTFKFIKL